MPSTFFDHVKCKVLADPKEYAILPEEGSEIPPDYEWKYPQEFLGEQTVFLEGNPVLYPAANKSSSFYASKSTTELLDLIYSRYLLPVTVNIHENSVEYNTKLHNNTHCYIFPGML